MEFNMVYILKGNKYTNDFTFSKLFFFLKYFGASVLLYVWNAWEITVPDASLIAMI